jgi:hypothetical protein
MSSFSGVLDRLITRSGKDAQAIAALVPCAPSHLSRLRKGGKGPSLQLAERLDEILGADGALVGAALTDGLPADRPSVLAAIGAVLDPSETAELARRLRSSEVDGGTLDMLARTTETLCTQYSYRDPVQLRRETLQWLGYLDGLLSGRCGLREHREVLVTAGWLTLLAGCLEYDLGMGAAAEATRVSAMHLGREAGHAEITAWSLELAAWFAHTRRDFPAAIAYARAGQDAAPHSGVAVQLAAHEARAAGRLGEKRQATAAMDRARAVLHALPLPANTVNHFVVDPAKLNFYAMDSARIAGDSPLAAAHAAEVLRAGIGPDGAEMAPMRMSEARLTLGCIAAANGDLDEAAAMGADAFTADRKCLPGLLLLAGELETAMRGRYPDAAPAREFREQLATARLALAAD